MNAKRPARIYYSPTGQKEWSPTDTQSLRVKVDLANETAWRRSTVDQIENMAETLSDVRDTAREAKADLNHKASKTELQDALKAFAVVERDLFWIKWLIGLLIPIVAMIAIKQWVH
jgi:hypothetical protein